MLLSGCKRDPVVPDRITVKATFTPVWNGEDFDKTDVYLSAANERVLIQLIKFYISDLTLVGSDASTVASRAELLELTNGEELRYMECQAGNYDRLRFGLGLPQDLNTVDITTVDPFSPLGNNAGMYWTWATLYRFMLFEGRYDTDPTATGTPPFSFSLHSGREQCYRVQELPFTTTAVLEPGDTLELAFEVDVARFFTDGDAVLDLSQGPQAHGEASTLPVVMEMSDLVVKAIDLR